MTVSAFDIFVPANVCEDNLLMENSFVFLWNNVYYVLY